MRVSYVIALLAMSASAGIALAAADAPATEPPVLAPKTEATAAAKPEEKLICRKIEELGSRLRASRLCLTRQEWADRREEERRGVDRSQSSSCVRGSGC